MTTTREQILAASAGWVAVVLNLVPGLGSGYLYQRRWRAYWITSALATAWFVAGAVLGQQAEAAAEAQNQIVGLAGLLALAAVTATEAGLELNWCGLSALAWCRTQRCRQRDAWPKP
jgi:hypothetical protein